MIISKTHLGQIISKTLKCERLAVRMSQEAMAGHLWITVSEYQALEQGKIKDPRISTVIKIAMRQNWDLNRMFGLNGHAKYPNTAFDAI